MIRPSVDSKIQLEEVVLFPFDDHSVPLTPCMWPK